MNLDDRRSPELEQLANEQAHAIAARFTELVTVKYVHGYQEHGGNLMTKGNLEWLIAQVEEECVDLFVYLHALRSRLGAMDMAIEKLLEGDDV